MISFLSHFQGQRKGASAEVERTIDLGSINRSRDNCLKTTTCLKTTACVIISHDNFNPYMIARRHNTCLNSEDCVSTCVADISRSSGVFRCPRGQNCGLIQFDPACGLIQRMRCRCPLPLPQCAAERNFILERESERNF